MPDDSKLTRIVNGILAGCAVILTCVVVARQLGFGDRSRVVPSASLVTALPNWRGYLAADRHVGQGPADVEIVEFGDFECPVCRYFTVASLKGVMAAFPGRVRLTFHHWPLAYHRFAYPAARAAECAAVQGRFAQMHDLLYEKQDSLGLKTFHDYARESGVSDLEAFDRCNGDAGPVPVIEADRHEAVERGFGGTPTVIIEGDLYSSAPDSAKLHQIVSEHLKRKVKR